MTTAEALRDAYHDLESELDVKAAELAARNIIARRGDIGEVCLTAQVIHASHDVRFDFREDTPDETRLDSLRLTKSGNGALAVECRRENEDEFREAIAWGCLDTLSKLLIIEGLEAASV